MGYMSLLAPCFVCKRLFNSNPSLVPSYQNNPICKGCIERVNRERETKGLALWPVLPGAYEAEEV